MNRDFMNLDWYEYNNLQDLMRTHKKWNGYSPIKLNKFDKSINKEHIYPCNRIMTGALWVICGLWLLPWIIFFLRFGCAEWTMFLWMLIPPILSSLLLLYNYSYDKIYYNEIISKNQQMNIFNDCGVEYKFSDCWCGYGKDKR